MRRTALCRIDNSDAGRDRSPIQGQKIKYNPETVYAIGPRDEKICSRGCAIRKNPPDVGILTGDPQNLELYLHLSITGQDLRTGKGMGMGLRYTVLNESGGLMGGGVH